MASTDNTPRGYIDTAFPNPNGPGDATIIIYGYTPSPTLAGLAIALFTLATIAHTYQLYRYRSWYFTPVPLGTLLETIGYIPRLLSGIEDPYRVLFFILQYFFIVVAPVLFSAGIYSTLAVLMRRIPKGTVDADVEKGSWILKPNVALWGFVAVDVVCTIVQVTGAALVGSRYSNRQDPTAANNILLAGLAVQAFTFLLFVGVLFAFTLRARKQLRDLGLSGFLVAFWVATLAVYLRTVFRLAETAEGLMQNLSTHEAFFGGLEFAPIVVAVCVVGVWFPGRCLQRVEGGVMGRAAAGSKG